MTTNTEEDSSSMTGHIVPMGAGKAVMERRNDPLHSYVLELTGKDDPVVLFVPAGRFPSTI